MEYLLIALTGLLSAPHCMGMCGGIMSAWTLHSRAPMLQTVLAYNSGRILTYTLVGAIMGFIGSFIEAAGKIVGIQGIANILGGLFILLWVFVKYALPITKWTPVQLPVVKKYLGEMKLKKGLLPVFISGLLLGFLPCGLTYGMFLKAAGTGHLYKGALTLAFFGLGTLPALLFISVFSHYVKKVLQKRILLVANILMVYMGVLSILRGMSINGWIPSINPWLW